jgi:fructokinase
VAVEALRQYKNRLARSLATVINVIDPDIIVLGGGLSLIPAIYPELEALIQKYVFTDVLSISIAPAVHGDSSGVRGAAWLWPASHPK